MDVRAGTEGFARDIERIRALVDSSLVSGFSRASDTLERGLTGAIRKGGLGFHDLKRIAIETIDAIAAHSLRGVLGSGSQGLNLSGLAGALLGLPGRATGGNVAPGRGYVVGERGPEVFVPTSAGRIEPAARETRDVRVSIHLNTPSGATTPRALQRSSRQMASAVRRALASP